MPKSLSITREYKNSSDLRIKMQYGKHNVELPELSFILVQMDKKTKSWSLSGIMRVCNFYSKKVQTVVEKNFGLVVTDLLHNKIILELEAIGLVRISKPDPDDVYDVTFTSSLPTSLEDLTETEQKIYKLPQKDKKVRAKKLPL